jgi:hypothetical protein
MPRRLAAVFAVLTFASAFAACGSDKKDSDTASATTTTSTTASNATTVAPTTVATTPPVGPASTPQAAANGLFNAWKKNDQNDAANYAKPQAISKMFAHPYNDPSVKYTNQGCEPQGGQFTCAWSYEGGAVTMTVEAWPGGGFVVDSVTYIAD